MNEQQFQEITESPITYSPSSLEEAIKMQRMQGVPEELIQERIRRAKRWASEMIGRDMLFGKLCETSPSLLKKDD